MGDAEDRILPQIDRDATRHERHKARSHKALIDQIYTLVPQVTANLERRGYPAIQDSDGQRVVVTLNGQRRIGWTVYREWGGEGYTHVLSDGTFVNTWGYNQETVSVVNFRDYLPGMLEVGKAEKIIENLRFLASYGTPQAKTAPPPQRPRSEERYETPLPPKSAWQRFWEWLSIV